MPESDEDIQKQFRNQMKALGQSIDNIFNGPSVNGGRKKTGFCLLVFGFEDPPATRKMNYVSNAMRPDMVKALEEFIARERRNT